MYHNKVMIVVIIISRKLKLKHNIMWLYHI